MQGQLCVLAEDCDQPDYKKLVEALCSEHNVSLLSVPEAKQLGQWAGVSRTAFMHASHNHGCICFTSEQQASLERLSRSLGTRLPRRCRWLWYSCSLQAQLQYSACAHGHAVCMRCSIEGVWRHVFHGLPRACDAAWNASEACIDCRSCARSMLRARHARLLAAPLWW